ncbi:hypothetical protein KP509_34G042800 [Ceratopteris richardii]|nr:hypothetical protein KP509_34G042800 [Ceratopteris richardii]
MSTDIGGRAVLKPAGNVARANLRKASKHPSPVKPPLNSPSSKFVSPSPLDASPKSLTRTLPLKPNSFCELSPSSPPAPSLVSLYHFHQDPLSVTPLDLTDDEAKSEPIETSTLLPKMLLSGNCSNTPSDVESEVGVSEASALGANDRFDTHLAMSTPFASASESCEADITPSDKGEKSSLTATSLSGAAKKLHDVMPYSTNVVHSSVSRTRRTIKPHIALNKSNSEVFQRNGCSGTATRAPRGRDNLNKLGSLSFNEKSLSILVAAKKEAAKEACLQRRLKVSDYGRRQGKAGRVAPEVSTASLSPPLELQRCKFITAQSDPIYVDYHDKEWGVPVHDGR